MEELTRKRVLRKLEALPEEQLYQVLDYIEFVESKYARRQSAPPDAFQRFAERVEDQMRARSLAPKAMKGTMRLMSTAGRVLDNMRDFGRDLWTAPPPGPAPGGTGGAGGAGGTGGAEPPAGAARDRGSGGPAGEVP